MINNACHRLYVDSKDKYIFDSHQCELGLKRRVGFDFLYAAEGNTNFLDIDCW